MQVLERRAVRAVVITPEREVLLMRTRQGLKNRSYWFTPGGGVESGETLEQALRRELQEELGLEEFALGPLLGQHRYNGHAGDPPQTVVHHQHIYLVQLARFEPVMSDPVEVLSLDEMRWWRLSELLETQELVFPLGLAQRVLRYLDHGEIHTEQWRDDD